MCIRDRTSTPGLAAADSMVDSNIPSVAYATVYPIAMVFLILFIQAVSYTHLYVDCVVYLVSEPFGKSLCKSGSFIPAQSDYRLFLYDACDVFQYIDQDVYKRQKSLSE